MSGTININIKKTPKSKISEVDFNNIIFGRVYSDHMFVADYKNGQWQDQRIVPYENLSLSPGCAVIHYGQSVFEGMKAYKNADGEILIFRPYENFKRINLSAERMCIPPVSEEMFMSGLNELIKLDRDWVPSQDGYSLYIRPFIFATDEYIGIRPSDNYKFVIFTCPVGAYYTKPVKVKIETYYSRTVEGGTGFAKAAGNYAASLLPMVESQRQGYEQLIWTDGKTHKFIEESGTMNVMFIIDGTLMTAPSGNTILKGITRDSVLTLAKDWGYKVEEKFITVDEVVDAIKAGKMEEAFGTGTAATIAQITTIGYEGVDYELPPIANRKFAPKVFEALENIKFGKTEDQHGWIYKVK
jgi:branched-chain amino acid aminotransferase